MPTAAYTYDNISRVTNGFDMAKDPCETLRLADGGSNATAAPGTLALVTGGAGFIGSNLVDRLLTLGYKVRILDNLYTGFIRNVPLQHENVEFVYGDILDREALQVAIKDVDYVFHLAAMSKVMPSLSNPDMARFCLESNALGSWNVLEEARIAGKIKKVVYAASSTYYGNAAPPYTESMAPNFLTPYASSKFEGEIQMQNYDQLFGVPTVSTRFFMVYGPRQPTTGAYAIVTGVFAKQAAEGKPLTIEGDGTHARDFIHVTDIVEGLILAQQTPRLRGGVINLGTGSSYSVYELADLVSKDNVHLPRRKHDLVRTLADTCRMKQLLNFQPKANFTQEMSFIVEATKAGNVFVQDWFTLPRVLSAPHLLADDNPMFGWPKSQNDLDALLVSLQHITGKLPGDNQRLVTVLPLSTVGVDTSNNPALRELLINTVYSLVRYGSVVRYMVIATDDEALKTCTELNLPCLDVRNSYQSAPALVDALLSRGYDVHYASVGSSYVTSVMSFLYSNSDNTFAAADVIRAQPQGDFFIRLNDNTHNAFAAMDKTGLVGHQSMFDQKDWPSTELKIALFPIGHFCDTSAKDEPPTMPKTPGHFVLSLHKACDVASGQLYIAVGCPDAPVTVTGAPQVTVRSLVSAGAFHVSRCPKSEHCDVQQIVPLLWIQGQPDLSTSGGLCS